MTRQELLSTARLQLNPRIASSAAHPLRVLLQAPTSARQVVVTAAERGLLTEHFSLPATVPAVLVDLLAKGRCPPLRNYYELILQCFDAGVLSADPARIDGPPARAWPVRLPLRWALPLGSLGFVAGVIAQPFGVWRLPNSMIEWIGGFVAACVLLSLGQVLAACALAGANCAVRPRRFGWRSPHPYFRVNTADAVMGGPAAERAVAALRLAPLAVGCAVASWWQPGFLFIPFLCLVAGLAPWGRSAAMQWLRARFGAPSYSVETGRLLELGENEPQQATESYSADLSRRGRIVWGFWMALWCAWIVAGVGRLLPGLMIQIAAFAERWSRNGPGAKAVLIAGLALIVFGAILLATAVVKRWLVRRQSQAPLGAKHSLLTHNSPLSGATIVDLLKHFVVLQDLSAEDRAALSGALRPVQFAPRSTVFEEDGPADSFYFVLDGALEIHKRLPGRLRRTKTIGLLGAGDSFGEIALLENSPRTATVRALRQSQLLQLSREDFDRLLTRPVGAARLREVLQNTAFLGRLVYFAGWSFEDLTRFAKRCTSVRFDGGVTVLRKGHPNAFFYLIYDGALEVREGAKVLRRLAPGDYFGESSLVAVNGAVTKPVTVDYFGESKEMELNPALTDVVAVEESRCLTMHRSDFLSFFAHDFRVSVRMAARIKRGL